MQIIGQDGSRLDEVRRLGKELTAIEIAIVQSQGNVVQIDTRLRIAEVDVVRSQQTMALGANVSDLEHHILSNFTLDIQVVLRRVLSTQVRGKLSE